MDGLRDAFDSGKAKAVAVCNYDKAQLEQAHELLAKHDIPLASNQVWAVYSSSSVRSARRSCSAVLQLHLAR